MNEEGKEWKKRIKTCESEGERKQTNMREKDASWPLAMTGIDKITFNSTGDTPYPGLNCVGTHFVLDDLDISI